MPFELSKVDEKQISKSVGKEVKVYSVKDETKYDPEGKSKKAIPGRPSVYLE